MGEPLVDRAPALLRSLGLVEPACDPAAMTVGACDLLLFDLRRWLFGPDLDLVVTCPACGEVVELVIPTAEVVPTHPHPGVSRVTVEEDGLRIRCRLPTNGDLREVAGIGPDATAADLLERCVEDIEGPDACPDAARAAPHTGGTGGRRIGGQRSGRRHHGRHRVPLRSGVAGHRRYPLDPVDGVDPVGAGTPARGPPVGVGVRVGRAGHPSDEPIPASLLP